MTLQESSADDPATEVTIEHLVAPFIVLDGMCAEELELEKAVLAFATMADSEITGAGFVGADLRGVHAPNVRWFDVSLVAADLRWANLEASRAPRYAPR